MKFELNLDHPWHGESLLSVIEMIEGAMTKFPSPNAKLPDSFKGDFSPEICDSWTAMYTLKEQLITAAMLHFEEQMANCAPDNL